MLAQWVQTNGPYGSNVTCFAVSPAGGGRGSTKLFAGTDGGVFRSTNGGANWTPANTGLKDSPVDALAVCAAHLFAIARGGGSFWRRPLSELVSVGLASSEFPSGFSLGQNYPNPFNPSTTIQYAVPHRSHIILTICNTLGQEIAQLINGDIDAGYHEVPFDGAGLASGVHFYRLLPGEFVQTRKNCF
jgi:hypothetical protein